MGPKRLGRFQLLCGLAVSMGLANAFGGFNPWVDRGDGGEEREAGGLQR